jgi:hypothetical protein
VERGSDYDLDLAGWLTSLRARSQSAGPAVVLPLYSAAPPLFASGDRIYISTGAILQFDREEDLALTLASVPKSRPRRHIVFPPACH